MIDIFVNYRTADQPLAALLLDQALTRRIGERVFRDYRTISPGEQYPGPLWAAIQQCRILVAVIGNRWLEADPHGRRRIDDPSDCVRQEIAEALRRGVRVVPVLIGDAKMPKADDLPEDLRTLPLHQYRTLRFRGLEQEVERVADELVALLDGSPAEETAHRASGHPSAPAAQAGHLNTPAGRPGRPNMPAAQSTVTNNFHGNVDASRAVFGVVMDRGE